jgi:hypothetical protein
MSFGGRGGRGGYPSDEDSIMTQMMIKMTMGINKTCF